MAQTRRWQDVPAGEGNFSYQKEHTPPPPHTHALFYFIPMQTVLILTSRSKLADAKTLSQFLLSARLEPMRANGQEAAKFNSGPCTRKVSPGKGTHSRGSTLLQCPLGRLVKSLRMT
uniref:Uncharacterized protein n=1 Tax=Sphaerodactylus townsendi TaxID=933632 RepID=A0ACB8EMQ2_9SAUR